MTRGRTVLLAVPFVAGTLALAAFGLNAPAEQPDEAADGKARVAAKVPPAEEMAASLEEARGQARLLHEGLHGSLQYVHREYFRDDEGLAIPAATMKNVFRDLAATRGVKLRWLAVNARAMNVDHEAADDFEKAAVKALSEGKEFHDAVEEGTYRFAGAVILHAECLSCHLPARSSNKPRTAALAISLPLRKPPTPPAE